GVEVRPLARRPPPWVEGAIGLDLLTARPDELDQALAGADAIVHLAGHDEVVAGREPERALVETIQMASRVADAAARVGVPRVVHVSTVHVYGASLTPGAVVDERTLPQPRHPYALARLATEHLFATAAGPGDVVVLRLTNSVGAPAHPDVDRWTLLVNDLCRGVLRHGEVVLRTAGLQGRDFVDLGDVCGVLAQACAPSALPAGTYDLGSGRTTRVREVADLVADAFERLARPRPPVVAPDPEGPPPVPFVVDVERLRAAGAALDTPLEASVEEVARFCTNHHHELEPGAR
ncbi:MAG: NAD-dependent epimerase/dehydratase family protein, partial [Actinomycetota bacterium]